MQRSITVWSAAALLAFGIGTAAAQPAPPPNPYGQVPPPRAEVVPPPRAGHYWEPGHWHWNGNHYAWVGGHWMGGRPHGQWVAGHWRWGGNHYVWVPAHWG